VPGHSVGVVWVLWLAPRFGLRQAAQTLGREQSRCGVSKDALEGGEAFLGSQIGKGFCNQPACISVGCLTGIFQVTIQLCLLQRRGRGQEQPSCALCSMLAVDPGAEGPQQPHCWRSAEVCLSALSGRLC